MGNNAAQTLHPSLCQGHKRQGGDKQIPGLLEELYRDCQSAEKAHQFT